MQQQSMVRRAAEEFKQGNYLAALDFYRRLSDKLGERNFRANILLCERMLRGQGGKDVTSLDLRATKVACVMDEFTFHCYAPECDLLPLTPDNAITELEAFNPDLLFIESAWRGKDELWNRKIGTLSQELRAVLQWCKQRQVPTVFWNKEDPVHFETFLTTAQQFDFVFTTDIDCIARYKAALGHERVYLLPFACQPKTHNPIELYARKDAFCFAGAYYVRYPERTRDLETYVAEFPKFKPMEIFDRNFGKDDINYQFPAEYQPFIVGTLPFNEIDKAYKGYRYSINLNSIKQSQTMFARRVFELLGSNTITVSNFSRGVRLMFGDLVIASDSGKEIVSRLQRMDDEAERKLQLAGLRKVMLEHTYGQRLAYVARKALGWRLESDLPQMVVVALVGTEDEYRQVLENYRAQRYERKRLLVVMSEEVLDLGAPMESESITVLGMEAAAEACLGDLVEQSDWLATMTSGDYYGPNYLLDLALATRYCDASVIGKAECYQWSDAVIHLRDPGRAYHSVVGLPVRASAIRGDVVSRERTLLQWLGRAPGEKWLEPGLAVDPFNYCLSGRKATDLGSIKEKVDDLDLDVGCSVSELIGISEGIRPAEFNDTFLPKLNAAKLNEVFGSITHAQISVELASGCLQIGSRLPDGQHEYCYARSDLPISALPAGGVLETYLDATPGLDVQYAFIFLNAKKERIGHAIHPANKNNSATIPSETSFVRIGWRIRGAGESSVRYLQWGHRKQESARLIGRSDTLLLTNHYPGYNDLYRNGFVHSRVKSYREQGLNVDVFRFRPNESTSYQEFQNFDVVTGGQEALRKLLDDGRYRRVLVHFLSPEMWEVLEHYPQLQHIVWIHGAEIHAWHRREFNYQSVSERAKARIDGEHRIEFWRGLLKPMPPNLKLVFVSRHFAEEVFEDLGFRLPSECYSIVHNPIDTDLFAYEAKTSEQRKRVLSIRPYNSRTYANDLSVKAILKISEKPCFMDMEFRFVGDGKLFDETLQPLRRFSNVIIERRFLTREEISCLHKSYGVFLVPSRMDTQGVSRDEAMSSGLVPITNAVGAIPEFVDESCGILAPAEDADALADGLLRLYESPTAFEVLSRSAAERVLRQSSAKSTIEREIALIRSDSESASPYSLLQTSPVIKGVSAINGSRVNEPGSERPVSFLSFDVEALPGRATEDHVGRLIWGRYGGEEYGIRRISRILDQHGIKGNFLIDFSACLLYGDKAVREVVDFILSQGHEVHVHLHPEWVVRHWGLRHEAWAKSPAGMDMFDEALNRSVLEYAVYKYKSFVGRDPVMFRAGGYRFNEGTVAAAKELGFKACSNFNSTRHADVWSSDDVRVLNNEPFSWPNGLIELPVDFSPEPLSHEWDKYMGSFDRVLSRKNIKTFNLTLHSWTLLTREGSDYFSGFSPDHEERLYKICEHLKESSNPMGYVEYLALDIDFPKAENCRFVRDPVSIVGSVSSCSICGATYGQPLGTDICPSCESRARHRQILDVMSRFGNPFDGHSVLACHANPVEMQAFLSKANRVVNFDVRPLGYADLQMDIQSMDKVEDGSFDTFVAIHVLNHVTDDRRALEEIYRVLRPGGLALITVPCRENASTEACENVSEHYGADALSNFGVGSYRRYGLNDAINLFSELFKVERLKGFDEMTGTSEYVFFLEKLCA